VDNASEYESRLNQLELEDETRAKELSIAEKKALIAEAKRRYGRDWRRFFSHFLGKGSGIDWSAIKFRLY